MAGDSLDAVVAAVAHVPEVPLRAGPYKIGEKLGSGGMGDVYLALREGHEPRAVKIVKDFLDHRLSTEQVHKLRDQFERRVRREVKALEMQEHPAVVKVFESGALDDGRLYYVMERLQGQSLRDAVGADPYHADEPRGRALPLDRVLGYVEQICAALQAGHDKGIYHRDLKPDNLFVVETPPGAVKILDYGIAKLVQETISQLTDEGQLLGTPFYAAPEQLDGRPIGPGADIYALGVTLYRVLSGRLPFPFSPGASLQAMLLTKANKPPIPLQRVAPDLPAGVAVVIDQCLADDPGRRPASADALWRALATTARGAEGAEKGGDRVGQQLGNWVLIRKIGAGGFGEVYLARNLNTEREVAIKLLNREGKRAGEIRFIDEARAATRIKHRNIIDVIDLGSTDDGLYFVMEHLRGQELAGLLRERGQYTPEELLPYVLQICDALQSAHDADIIHRDLKPENIFVQEPDPRTQEREIKILDFGIAKVLENDLSGSARTVADMPMGTPQYFAPEQAVGDLAAISPRTDLYSLGVILYEALAGERPFAGGDLMQSMNQHLVVAPPPITDKVPELPPGIAKLVMQCLEKEPDKRPASAREVCARFESALREPTAAERPQPRKRRPTIWLAVAAVVLVAAGVPLFLLLRPGPGSMEISATPSEVEIFVDGARVGRKTPLTLRRPGGRYMLRLKRAGYRDWSKTVEIRADERTAILAPLTRLPQKARLELTSVPSGHRVFIDGQIVGRTPVRGGLVEPGQHLVEVRPERGFAPWRGRYRFEAGETQRLEAMLTPQPEPQPVPVPKAVKRRFRPPRRVPTKPEPEPAVPKKQPVKDLTKELVEDPT